MIRGRTSVIVICREVADMFDTVCTDMLNVAVNDGVVLAEEWTQLQPQLPGSGAQSVMGFSSYRMECL